MLWVMPVVKSDTRSTNKSGKKIENFKLLFSLSFWSAELITWLLEFAFLLLFYFQFWECYAAVKERNLLLGKCLLSYLQIKLFFFSL